MNTLDLIFIVLYFLLVFFVAFWKTKKSSEDEFLIAERKVGVLGTLSSINATKTGSILLIFTALLYSYGFSAAWYFVGLSSGYLLFIPFATKVRKASTEKTYTLADYFFHRYGNFSGKCASLLNMFTTLAWLMLNLVASSKVLSFFTGLSFEWSLIIVAVFVLLYLLVGGFKAVVTTDVIQYTAIVLIFILFAFILFTQVDIPSVEWNLGTAGAKNIFGFFLIGILIPFATPDLFQRVYASKNEKVLRKGIIYSIIVYLFVAFLLSIIGLSVKTQFPHVDPDIALIHGFAHLLPAGLVGLAVVIFFAAFMSSIDTYAYTVASSFIHDFFRNFSKKQLVKAIKWAIVAVILLASLIAVAIQDLLIGGFLFAGYAIVLAIPVIASWIKPSIKVRTLNTTFVFGMIFLTLFVIKDALAGTLSPTIIIIGLASSLLGLLIGSLFSWIKK